MEPIFVIILLILLFILIFLIGFYYINFAKSLYLSKVPYVGSFGRQLEMIKKIDIPKNSKIVDLGCGDGKALRFFEKQFGTIGVGYDINLFAILYGKFLNKILKSNIELIKDDFIGKDISKYNYIYIYLFPEFLSKIEDRMFKEKSPETIIISTAFRFYKHEPFKIINNKIYLYK